MIPGCRWEPQIIIATLPIVVLSLVLASCSTKFMRQDDVRKEAEQLFSLANESSYLCSLVAAGSASRQFRSMHANALEKKVSEHIRKLTSAQHDPALAGQTEELERMGKQMANALVILQNSGPQKASELQSDFDKTVRLLQTAKEAQ